MAATLLLSIEARRRLGPAARPSSFDCAATVWCGRGGSHDATRQAVLLCFRVAVAAFYAEFLLNFFSSSSFGKPAGEPPGFGNLFFTIWNFELQLLLWCVAVLVSADRVLGRRTPSRSIAPLEWDGRSPAHPGSGGSSNGGGGRERLGCAAGRSRLGCRCSVLAHQVWPSHMTTTSATRPRAADTPPRDGAMTVEREEDLLL